MILLWRILIISVTVLFISSGYLCSQEDKLPVSHLGDCTKAERYVRCTKATVSKGAPDFEGTAVLNGKFKRLKLCDFRGRYIVLFFYPLDFTFVCPTELLALNEKFDEFCKLNTEILAVSVDSPYTHYAWANITRKDGGIGCLRFPLMSDLCHRMSKDYGVYMEDAGHALRGTFIIDKRGVLRHISINDLAVGRNIEEIVRLIQAYQYSDEHGEACPAGWRP